jgi:acyl dehydratase
MLTTRIDERAERAGTELGTSDWVAVTQEAVDAFAAATGDHQWIHTVPERAADSPFGGTIAHGNYTLPTGEQVRMRVGLDAVEPVPGGAALSLNLTFEPASGGKPVCVANAVYRVYEQR